MTTSNEPAKRSASSCRPCAACCVFLPIPAGQISPGDKPAGIPCSRLNAAGCGAYAGRPELCQRFRCAWLADASWPELWRPDRSGLLCLREEIDAELLAAAVYEIRPGAVQETAAEEILDELANTAALVVLVDNQHGQRRLLERTTVDPAEHRVPAPHFLDESKIDRTSEPASIIR